LRLNLRACSSLISHSNRSKGSNVLTAKSTREVQFAEDGHEKGRSTSIESDKTDYSDKEEIGVRGTNMFGMIFSGKYWPSNDFEGGHLNLEFDGRINFDGIDSGIVGESCYGNSSKCKGVSDSGINEPGLNGSGVIDDSEFNGSGQTSMLSNPSRRASIDSDATGSKCVVYGQSPTHARVKTRAAESEFEEIIIGDYGVAQDRRDRGDRDEGFVFGSLIISETCSLASDCENNEEDCFEGLPICRCIIPWVFGVFIPYLQAGKCLQLSSANQVINPQYISDTPFLFL